MSRISRALFLALPAFSVACSDDTQTPAGTGETGGALIFGNGGGSGSGGSAGGGGGATSGNGGGSSDGGQSTSGGSSNGGVTSSDGGNSGTGGTSTPSSGGAGNGGSPGDGGSPGNGGANPTGTGGFGGGGPTGLPVGSLCANDSNCAPNICCKLPACGGPCECQPASNCPTSTQFLPCNNAADCSVYGGGKICCRASSGGQTMQYCTKTNGCPGTTLP